MNMHCVNCIRTDQDACEYCYGANRRATFYRVIERPRLCSPSPHDIRAEVRRLLIAALSAIEAGHAAETKCCAERAAELAGRL